MKRTGEKKEAECPLKGGDVGWCSFRLTGAQKREIWESLKKAGIPAKPIAKFNQLFRGIERIVNDRRAIDEGGIASRFTPKEIGQEIGRLQDSIEHLQKNLSLLYGGDLQESLDASLIVDFKMAKPSVFIHRLKEDLETLNAALRTAGEDFKIQRGRPSHPKGIKTFLAVELARIFHDALGIVPTSTQYNPDAQTKDGPFVFLLRRVYKLCDLDITDLKPYALEAIHELK